MSAEVPEAKDSTQAGQETMTLVASAATAAALGAM